MMNASNAAGQPMPRYMVGIDLGTTHTVVAYADTVKRGNAKIELFQLEQLIAPGQTDRRPLLPSTRYHPAQGELSETDMRLPWTAGELCQGAIFGTWARELGAKSHGRLVTSAKSWLCHSAVDRTAAILPWGAPADAARVSPLEASASYLSYVRAAWNQQQPEHPLEAQEVILTLPASFDESARALTLEAARLAGLRDVQLLEEPQAACYDWLWRHRKSLRRSLSGVNLLLIVDVGGGTTDLTLIRVEHGEDARPELSRIGVGNHLMLGGDNIDLTLAHRLEQRLVPEGQKLTVAQLAQLVEQCRSAKERLLAGDGTESASVTLLGGGSRLVGGARSTALSASEVSQVVLDGFFPLVPLDQRPERRRSAVVEFGLPYVADPAVSRHLAAFLSAHAAAPENGEGGLHAPDAILLNGGAFRSPLIESRVLDLLESWTGRRPKQLKNDRPDLAVACGAVAYAMARHGLGVGRIGGGSPRSFFLLVDTDSEGREGVCLLPKGCEEGREIVLEGRSFALRLGQPVRFHLVSSAGEVSCQPGEMVALDDPDFIHLPPLAVAFRENDGAQPGDVRVRLSATLSEIGTLSLQCIAEDDPTRRWDVEFQLRGQDESLGADDPDGQTHPRLNEAVGLIQKVFGKKAKEADPKAVRGLRSELEKRLGKRDEWDTKLLRELSAPLLDGMPHRRRTAEHERLWLSLTGYCLRPGFGVALDDWRVERLWPIYESGIQHVNEAQNWAEWWTLWRRVCGGLGPTEQTRIFQDLSDFIDPRALKRGNLATLARKRAFEDMLRLAATLERLPPVTKVELGGWLLERLQKGGDAPAEFWWALGRIGSRIPFHGSSHEVVPVDAAEAWLGELQKLDWKKQPLAGFAATLMARLCEDRERDVSAELRAQVVATLQAAKAPETWVAMVKHYVHLDQADSKRAFGEALPPGLKLLV